MVSPIFYELVICFCFKRDGVTSLVRASFLPNTTESSSSDLVLPSRRIDFYLLGSPSFSIKLLVRLWIAYLTFASPVRYFSVSRLIPPVLLIGIVWSGYCKNTFLLWIYWTLLTWPLPLFSGDLSWVALGSICCGYRTVSRWLLRFW
jgi:hypothetical protein